ncbi:hypothetical protein OIU76_014964 [Salix suchowensis]|nr:hypothetical protein OIU76_014964 [Salix suchowensis]
MEKKREEQIRAPDIPEEKEAAPLSIPRCWCWCWLSKILSRNSSASEHCRYNNSSSKQLHCSKLHRTKLGIKTRKQRDLPSV